MATLSINNGTSVPSSSAGDTLLFQSGSVAVNGSIDQSGLGAGGYAFVRVFKDFVANVGTASAPFKAEISSGTQAVFEYAAGGGTFHYTADGNSDLCDLIQHHGAGHLYVLGSVGTVTLAQQWSGMMTIGGSVVVTTLIVGGSAVCKVEDGGGTRPTTVRTAGGRTTLNRTPSGTLDVFGGFVEIDDDDESGITTVELKSGTISPARIGDITTMNWYGGSFDVSRLAAPVTITTLNVYAGAPGLAALLSSALVTVTNLNYVGWGE